MKTIKIGKLNVTFYSGIKDMPVKKYDQMQSLLLQDFGIGSTMADVDKHFRNLDSFLQSGNIEDANIERQNLQLAFYSAIEKINYKSLAFACLIHSINDIQIKDTSDEGIQQIIERLSNEGLEVKIVEEMLNELKKNCIMN
jgi:hypothetical protein